MIKCPACEWKPPKQQQGEDFIWYGYRKWRALANHMATDHMRELALTHRRIEAEQRRIDARQRARDKS